MSSFPRRAHSPRRLLGRVRRSLGLGPTMAEGGLERVPDDLPRDGLFAQPLRVSRIVAAPPEERPGGELRVAFTLTVRDADDRRCPDLAVEATIAGPERTSSGMAHTDLLGSVRFRMTGPPGRYRLQVDSVAGGALRLDEDASVLQDDIDARAPA